MLWCWAEFKRLYTHNGELNWLNFTSRVKWTFQSLFWYIACCPNTFSYVFISYQIQIVAIMATFWHAYFCFINAYILIMESSIDSVFFPEWSGHPKVYFDIWHVGIAPEEKKLWPYENFKLIFLRKCLHFGCLLWKRALFKGLYMDNGTV